MLKKDQSQSVEVVECTAHVGATGFPADDSANLGPKRLAKQRIQRMRRRHERAYFGGNARLGWATRML